MKVLLVWESCERPGTAVTAESNFDHKSSRYVHDRSVQENILFTISVWFCHTLHPPPLLMLWKKMKKSSKQSGWSFTELNSPFLDSAGEWMKPWSMWFVYSHYCSADLWVLTGYEINERSCVSLGRRRLPEEKVMFICQLVVYCFLYASNKLCTWTAFF